MIATKHHSCSTLLGFNNDLNQRLLLHLLAHYERSQTYYLWNFVGIQMIATNHSCWTSFRCNDSNKTFLQHVVRLQRPQPKTLAAFVGTLWAQPNILPVELCWDAMIATKHSCRTSFGCNDSNKTPLLQHIVRLQQWPQPKTLAAFVGTLWAQPNILPVELCWDTNDRN